MSFYNIVNNASAIITLPHTAGDGVLSVNPIGIFGSGGFPIRVTCVRQSDNAIVIYAVGSSGATSLNITGVLENTVDINLAVNDVCQADITAGALRDIHDAIDAINASGAGSASGIPIVGTSGAIPIYATSGLTEDTTFSYDKTSKRLSTSNLNIIGSSIVQGPVKLNDRVQLILQTASGVNRDNLNWTMGTNGGYPFTDGSTTLYDDIVYWGWNLGSSFNPNWNPAYPTFYDSMEHSFLTPGGTQFMEWNLEGTFSGWAGTRRWRTMAMNRADGHGSAGYNVDYFNIASNSQQFTGLSIGGNPSLRIGPYGIQEVELEDGGSGFTNGTGYSLIVTGNAGQTAVGTFDVVGNAVTNIALSRAGWGYDSDPTFSFANAGAGTGVVINVLGGSISSRLPMNSLSTIAAREFWLTDTSTGQRILLMGSANSSNNSLYNGYNIIEISGVYKRYTTGATSAISYNANGGVDFLLGGSDSPGTPISVKAGVDASGIIRIRPGETSVPSITMFDSTYGLGMASDGPAIFTAQSFRVKTGGVNGTTVANFSAAGLGLTGAATITPVSTSTSALILKGTLGQTANIAEWQDSLGGLYGSIGATGLLTLFNDAASSYATRRSAFALQRKGLAVGSFSHYISYSCAGSAADNSLSFELCDGTTSGHVNTLTLLGNGRVGIGTQIPSAPLEVLKSTTGVIASYGANGATGLCKIGYESSLIGGIPGSICITSSPFGPFVLETQNDKDIYLLPNGGGKVGISCHVGSSGTVYFGANTLRSISAINTELQIGPVLNSMKFFNTGVISIISEADGVNTGFDFRSNSARGSGNLISVSNAASSVMTVDYIGNIFASGYVVAKSLVVPVTTVTSNTTLTPSHHFVKVNAASAPVTIILPSVAITPEGRQYIVKKVDSSLNQVLVSGVSNIDGVNSQVITTQYSSITLISDSVEWSIV